MKQMTPLEMEKEVEKCIETGKYPVIDKHLFDNVENYKPSKKAQDSKAWLLEEYNEYIEMLMSLPQNLRDAFLEVLKNYDIRDNQKLENEPGFLIDFQDILKNNPIHAIDYILKCDSNPLTKEDLKKTHGILMEGTRTSSEKDYDFRKYNDKFVGTYEGGERIINYIPPRVTDIETLADLFLEYYNSEELNKDLFTSPIIEHGLLATMQIFDDGNTRLSRVLQHAKLYHQTKTILGYDFSNPILYCSKMYYPQRGEYRRLTVQMAKNPDNEAFDNWILFNHKIFRNQIYRNEERIRELKISRKL